MQATQDITITADRTSAKRWRTAAGVAMVIAAVSLALALTRARQVEHIPVLVHDVSATQVAITSSAATHERGPYDPSSWAGGWTEGGKYLPPTPSAWTAGRHGPVHVVSPRTWER